MLTMLVVETQNVLGLHLPNAGVTCSGNHHAQPTDQLCPLNSGSLSQPSQAPPPSKAQAWAQACTILVKVGGHKEGHCLPTPTSILFQLLS